MKSKFIKEAFGYGISPELDRNSWHEQPTKWKGGITDHKGEFGDSVLWVDDVFCFKCVETVGYTTECVQ